MLIRRSNSDAGFSLLEVLVALAIMSLTTLALFQSFNQLNAVSDRVVRSTTNSLDSFVEREVFDDVVSGLIAGWEDEGSTDFRGHETAFTSLAALTMASEFAQLSQVTVQLDRGRDQTPVIRYLIGEQTLTYPIPEALSPRLTYLGWDQNWYSDWPLEQAPSTGFFDDAIYAVRPQLPMAIRVIEDDGSDRVHFMATTSQRLFHYKPEPVDGLAQ